VIWNILIKFYLNLFCSPITNDKDELVAIQLEISEINKQINRLRRRRSHLNKQQQKLKETIKQAQQSTTVTRNLNEQWERTGT